MLVVAMKDGSSGTAVVTVLVTVSVTLPSQGQRGVVKFTCNLGCDVVVWTGF